MRRPTVRAASRALMKMVDGRCGAWSRQENRPNSGSLQLAAGRTDPVARALVPWTSLGRGVRKADKQTGRNGRVVNGGSYGRLLDLRSHRLGHAGSRGPGHRLERAGDGWGRCRQVLGGPCASAPCRSQRHVRSSRSLAPTLVLLLRLTGSLPRRLLVLRACISGLWAMESEASAASQNRGIRLNREAERTGLTAFRSEGSLSRPASRTVIVALETEYLRRTVPSSSARGTLIASDRFGVGQRIRTVAVAPPSTSGCAWKPGGRRRYVEKRGTRTDAENGSVGGVAAAERSAYTR